MMCSGFTSRQLNDFSFQADGGSGESKASRVGIYMTIYSLVVTVAYLVNKNPLFHEVRVRTGSVADEKRLIHSLKPQEKFKPCSAATSASRL